VPGWRAKVETPVNINGIGSSNGVDALTALSNNTSTSGPDATQNSASTPASSTSVSKPAEFMAKLSQLLQQDPAKFKQVTQQISDQLKTAAQSASGPQAQFLTKLSDDFSQASSSGSLASLQPPGGDNEHATVGGHHHHGGGHHGGGGSGGIESVMSNALAEINQALSGTTASATTNVAAS
jgi:hypothetical protein